VHLVALDPDPKREPLADYVTLQKELAQFDAKLSKRPCVVALSKLDLPEARAALPALKKAFKRRRIELLAISAATGEGLAQLLDAVEPLLAIRDGLALATTELQTNARAAERRKPTPTTEPKPARKRTSPKKPRASSATEKPR
jgi:GTP-binding protein